MEVFACTAKPAPTVTEADPQLVKGSLVRRAKGRQNLGRIEHIGRIDYWTKQPLPEPIATVRWFMVNRRFRDNSWRSNTSYIKLASLVLTTETENERYAIANYECDQQARREERLRRENGW